MTILTRATNLVRAEGDPRVLSSGHSSLQGVDQLARALGWFSIALGIAELLGARSFTRALGVHGKESLVRACGVREIASGVVTLSTERPLGLWSRVAGDAMDLGALAVATKGSRRRGNAALALGLVAGVTLLDLLAAEMATTRRSRGDGAVRDYRDRSGYPRGLEASRGVAGNVRLPADLTAEPLLGRVSRTTGRTSSVAESLGPERDRPLAH
jgi:hypothetical protein